MRRSAGAIVGLALGGGFYLLLIDTVQSPELYAGVGAVLLAVIAQQLSRRQGFAEATIQGSWLLRAPSALGRVPTHVWLLTREAILQAIRPQARRGNLRAVRFASTGSGKREMGSRALAEALGSIAPNSIVIGVDREHELLLAHQLHVKGGREELDVLSLG